MKEIKNLSKKLTWARATTHALYALLLMTLLTSGLLRNTPWLIVLFSLLPLLIFIPTIKKESYKGLSLLCFVLLMYFLVTTSNLFAPRNWLAFDWVELIAECGLFISAMLFSRWKQYSLYQDDA